MDQGQAPPHPCIIQALPATIKKESPAPPRRVKGRRTPTTIATNKTPPQPPRCTRSQAAPDWTLLETLVLISEVAALDEDWLRALSSYQRWKIVSDNCAASDVARSSNQCKRKWESLLADYTNIRHWHSRSADASYWRLQADARKRFDLPPLFHQEVFDAMDAVIRPQEARTGFGDSDSEDLVAAAKAEFHHVHVGTTDSEKEAHSKNQMNVFEAQDVPSDLGDSSPEELIDASDIEMLGADTDSGSEKETQSVNGKSPDKAKEMAKELEESAWEIHAILRGDIADSAGRDGMVVDMTKPTETEIEFTRRQADALIKAFGGLAGTLDQFAGLIKDGQSESFRAISSMSL